LTGNAVEIAPLTAMPQESRIGDGKTIYLPATVAEFGQRRDGFSALQSPRGARRRDKSNSELTRRILTRFKAAFTELFRALRQRPRTNEHFRLAGYIEDVQAGERAYSPRNAGGTEKTT
jgi:hypothetical protein